MKQKIHLLTRSPAQGNRFYVLWPECREFVVEGRESFILWDEVLMRDFKTGKVLKRMPGSICPVPNGQNGLLS